MDGAPRPLPSVVIYSRKDADLLGEFLDHLSPLQRQGIITVWIDRNLEPGTDWQEGIKERLRTAKLVFVLVSASCLASNHCQDEINLALDREGAGQLRLIPIKLHEVAWEGEPLARLQVLPKHGGALSAAMNRHKEWADVTRAIRELAKPTGLQEEASDASVTNERALACADLGDLSSARALLEPAIEAARKSGSPDLAVLLSNYAHVLRAAGELEAARRILEETLALTFSADPSMAIRLDRLACVLRELGEPERAKPLAEQALERSLQAHGENHSTVAARRNTLGLIWTDLGETERAIQQFKKGVSILCGCIGEGAPAVAAIRSNLALALRDRGDLKAAKQEAEQALAADGEAYQKPHPAVATDLNTLGLILRDQGEASAATQHLRKAQEIFSQIFGEFHPSTRAVRDNLRITVQRLSSLR